MKQLIAPLLCLAATSLAAQTNVTVTFPCTDATAWGSTYTVSSTSGGANDDNLAKNFQSIGGHSTSAGIATETESKTPAENYYNAGVTFVKFQQKADVPVTFTLIPENGITFTPTKVYGLIERFGTDGCSIAVNVSNEDGKTFDLATALKGPRATVAKTEAKNSGVTDHFDLAIASDKAMGSTTAFKLTVTCANNGNEKDGYKTYGLSAIRIEGTLSGTAAPLAKHTLTLATVPADLGTVTATPQQAQYSEGAKVSLAAAKKFGYKFKNWTSGSTVLSTEANYQHTIGTADATLTANYETLTTYSATIGVTGVDASKSYLVTATPAPTNGKYEAGTTVTLTAREYTSDDKTEKFVSFTGWSDGSTETEHTVTVNAALNITASYQTADIVAGWDFNTAGGGASRAADWYSEDNSAVSLNLQKDDGTAANGTLDKSHAKGGVDGMDAVTNWRTTNGSDPLGTYNFYTTLNTKGFTGLTADFYMECSAGFQAYSKQNFEYSLDGNTWTKITTVTLVGKGWINTRIALPEACENVASLKLRWKSDTSSEVVGSEGTTDAQALAQIFITGTPGPDPDDHTAPTLTASTPANNANNASAQGRIVLTFNEKVVLDTSKPATLTCGQTSIPLTATATGTTLSYAYKGLAYNALYAFTLPAGGVKDRSGNATTQAVSLSFKTKQRDAVSKTLYNDVVGTVEQLLAALDKANKANATANDPYRIFIKNGLYKLPASETAKKTGFDNIQYPDPTTYLTGNNICLIGESRDGVVITNTLPAVEKKREEKDKGPVNVLEGIGGGDVLDILGTNTYLQSLTLKSSMGDGKGRDIVVQEKGDHTVYKNVCLWGYQDTWTSNANTGHFYFEDCLLRGRTDFLCGKGDAYFLHDTLQMCDKGGYIAVPSAPAKEGWVFKECVIRGEAGVQGIDGNYTLGRPWGSGTPIALFIDTKMLAKPSAAGWNEMSGGYPKQFAEYNSTDAQGNAIPLDNRKTTFNTDKTNVPTIDQATAEALTLSKVIGGTTDWDPTSQTEQCETPKSLALSADGTKLTWTADPYALLYVVRLNGDFVATVTEPEYTLPTTKAATITDVYTVQAANAMGGLSEAARFEITRSALRVVGQSGEALGASQVVGVEYYTLSGVRTASPKGATVVVTRWANGGATSKLVLVK